MNKRKHLDENDDCASARLVRMVKWHTAPTFRTSFSNCDSFPLNIKFIAEIQTSEPWDIASILRFTGPTCHSDKHNMALVND